MKKCSKCKRTKQDNEFYKNGVRLSSQCRDCQHKQQGIGIYDLDKIDESEVKKKTMQMYSDLKKLGVDLEKMPYHEWEGDGEIPKDWKPKKEWMLKKKETTYFMKWYAKKKAKSKT